MHRDDAPRPRHHSGGNAGLARSARASLHTARPCPRAASGRDPETGNGDGNSSWIGLSLGMIVLDSLSRSSPCGHVRNHSRRPVSANVPRRNR
jgi:hypothetical protein